MMLTPSFCDDNCRFSDEKGIGSNPVENFLLDNFRRSRMAGPIVAVSSITDSRAMVFDQTHFLK